MQWPTYICELCRNIHVLGESKENTVIRLADNAKGFENKKAVIRFNTASEMYAEKESTNCAMENTVKDITIDCGKGNGGAVGIYYVSSNLGRIENVNITAESGYCGVFFDMGYGRCFQRFENKRF